MYFFHAFFTQYVLGTYFKFFPKYVLSTYFGKKGTYEYVLGGKSTYSNGAVQVSMIRYLGTSRYVSGCTEYVTVLRFTIPDGYWQG